MLVESLVYVQAYMELHGRRRFHDSALCKKSLGLQMQWGNPRDPWQLRGTQWLLQGLATRALERGRTCLAHGLMMDVSALGESRLLAAEPVVLSDD